MLSKQNLVVGQVNLQTIETKLSHNGVENSLNVSPEMLLEFGTFVFVIFGFFSSYFLINSKSSLMDKYWKK